MDNLISPCKSRPPPMSIPSKRETPFQFSQKPIPKSVSFSKTRPVKITDTHLSFLCKNGKLIEAVNGLESVAQHGSKIKPDTYIQLLQSCIDSGSIEMGRKIHARIDLVDDVDLFVETKLVGMYAKCGCLEGARKVFDEMRVRDVYTWSAMIGACAREQRWREVTKLFYLMMGDGIVPDGFLFPKILQACGNCGDVDTGKLIQSLVIRIGMNCFSERRVSNSILSVYSKCGELRLATRFFEDMDGRDRIAWNAMISGYCHNGKIEEAVRLFDKMQKEGIEPGLVTWNILISSYSQAGNYDAAMELMNKMESFGITPDVFTWTSMISGLTRNNKGSRALDLFRDMVLAGVEPSGVTITSAISACASLQALDKGKEVHSIAVKIGSIKDVLVRNSLIDMYSKCKDLEAAECVFNLMLEKDVYTWNSMIGGYCRAGYCGKAYDHFMKMQESDDVRPNAITWNVMISGYMHNGDEDLAIDLVQKMDKEGIVRNTATWNSLVAGCVQNGLKNKALEMFRKMQVCRVIPNYVTVLSILPACANLVSVKKVKEIHCYVIRSNLESELSIANALMDAYAKSGMIWYSKKLFDGISVKDIISWNTLINGYVLHGCSNSALDHYDQMKKVGIKPNKGTFLSIIFAYSLAKMVDEGKHVFSSMIDDYQILAGLEHYSAMIDLFGRSGRLEEAIDFIKDMNLEEESSIWNALITACRIQGNVNLAIHAGERLLELEPGNDSINRFVLRAYILCGNSKGALKIKNHEQKSETKRYIGQSWVEINNTVCSFMAGDCSRPYSDFLYSWIKSIGEKEKVNPHDSHRELCFEEEDEEIDGVHSEKLALAFILLSSKCAPKSIRIIKNLRMSRDCHRTAKFITIMYGCEIYLKDSNCFHHFKNGVCSCGDYW